MAERGRGPHGSAGTPPPQIPATGSPGRPHGGREPATPQRGERWSSRAPKGAWNFGEGEKREARVPMSPESPLRAYVSAPPPHGALALSPRLM